MSQLAWDNVFTTKRKQSDHDDVREITVFWADTRLQRTLQIPTILFFKRWIVKGKSFLNDKFILSYQ